MIVFSCAKRQDRRHILVLCSTSAFEPIFQGFKAQMEQLGYREDVEVSYDFHAIDPNSGSFPFFEKVPLEDKRIDLIFAFPTEAAIEAKAIARQIPDLPVVFAYAGIENADLVDSVREPGGQVTGVRYPGPEQIGKRLEMLHTIAPHIRKVWIGYLKDYPNSEPALAVLRPLAKVMEIDLLEAPVDSLDALAVDLKRHEYGSGNDIDAMLLMPDTLNHSPKGWRLINGFADRHNLPLGGSFLYTVEQGAVFGNANDLGEIGALAAPLAAKVFSGIPAGTIPVVTPEQDLYINYKRAQELGLHLPEGLLRQAKVILR
jgi:putative ABC transport system substrate-binding protein